MVALDSMPGDTLQRLAAAGGLANLAAFLGASPPVPVDAEGGVISGATWPTFAAGAGAGSHGRYFSAQWLAEELRHVRMEHEAFAYAPFWLGAGIRTTLFDAPYVPATRDALIQSVFGWGTHDELVPFSHPAGLRKELERRHGRSPLTFDTLEPQDPAALGRLAANLATSAARRAAILVDLAGRADWDLLIVNFSETHRALHYLSAPAEVAPGLTNEDAMVRILRPLDDAWPRVLAAVGAGTHVILFSLQGATPHAELSTFGVHVDALLRGNALPKPASTDLVRRIRNAVPQGVHQWLWRRLPERVRAARISALALAATDFTSDDVFPVLHGDGPAYRLNLAGRERDGIVAAARAEEVLARAEAVITGIETPAGERAFAPPHFPQRLYPGPRAHRLPDVVLSPNPALHDTPTHLVGPGGVTLARTHRPVRNGGHTSQGFLSYRGAGGSRLAAQRVAGIDFAPTILRLLGAPAPRSLAGTPVTVE